MTNVMFWAGLAAVAGGLGFAGMGAARVAVAGRRGGASAPLDALYDPDFDGPKDEGRPLAERLAGPAAEALARMGRAITPSGWLARMRRKTAFAGLGGAALEGLLAAKGILTLAGASLLPLAAAAVGAKVGGVVLWAVFGGGIGFLLPDVWVARRADRRQADIRRTLPETLDLMAISVQAGLGLEGAIELVSRKLPGALGEELQRLLQETQLGTSRREALEKLRSRTDVPVLSAFTLALVQADTIGSPIAEVLRSHAAEIRMLRRQRARETAAKVPVKLLFPLLFGIFPALAIVVIGPAAISIARAFGAG